MTAIGGKQTLRILHYLMNQENGHNGIKRMLDLGTNKDHIKIGIDQLELHKLIIRIETGSAKIVILFRITPKGMLFKPLVDELIKAYDYL